MLTFFTVFVIFTLYYAWKCISLTLFFGDRKRLAESEARLVEAEKEKEDRSKDLEEKEKEILQLKEEVENLKELDKIKDVTSQLRCIVGEGG